MRFYLSLLAAACVAGHPIEDSPRDSSNIIYKDFAIIGGGAAGTYAAIALKDQGKSFVVIEKENRLGGHAQTYQDPVSGKWVDYGVQIYLNSSVVRDFFTRLNAPYMAPSPTQFGSPVYADLAKKQLFPSYNAGATGTDYVDLLHQYAPGADDLTYLKDPVDPDLTLTWVDFIKKKGLSDASARATFNRPAVPGNLLEDLAIYVFNDDNDIMLTEHQQYGGLVNANRDNSQMYQNAQTELGNSVLYKSTVTSATRANKNISLVVKTPTGNRIIRAKSLIIAMPQVMDNMKTFGLSTKEKQILSQISGGYYYGGVVSNTGFNSSNSYPNRGIDNQYNVASLPSIVTFTPGPIAGFHYYWYSTLTAASQSQIESAAADAIKTLQTLLKLPTTTPKFNAYSDFSPLQLRVSAQNITNGFYEDFNALQGYRSTWYIGTLQVTGSSQVWNNTKNMLPDIIAAAC